MRALLLLLSFAGCSSAEPPCLLQTATPLTEAQAAALVADGGVLVSSSVECDACARDETVSPGSADAPAQGYCVGSCGPGLACAAGTHCVELDLRGEAGRPGFCLRRP